MGASKGVVDENIAREKLKGWLLQARWLWIIKLQSYHTSKNVSPC